MPLALTLRIKIYPVLSSCILALFFFNCTEKQKEYAAVQIEEEVVGQIPDSVDFAFHIKPILSDRCFTCHGPDKNAVEGNLSLHKAEDAYAALGENKDRFAIVPNDPDNSELIKRIFHEDPNLQMPPPESNLRLSAYEKALLKKWIEQGAVYKKHWAFIPPEAPKVPQIENDTWSTNEIDKFVLEKLTSKNFKPSEKANKAQLLRRVFFTLTGLPPNTTQLNAFLNDASEDAYEKVVDSLLNTTAYAEHMAADWMDVARYADTHGYQDDFERTMWPWRDWVIHAFNKNIPYDEFVTQQLAGDMLPNADKASVLATGFNRNHKITYEGGVIPEEYRIEYVEDRTNTFGTAFLGMTMECARCHDHKYDPISQKDHFQLFGFFNNIDEKGLMDGGAQEIPKPYLTITKEDTEKVLDFVNMTNVPQKELAVMVMKDMPDQRETFVLNRGVYDQPTEAVNPSTPEAILPFPEEFPKNRLGLSQWLFHEKNPLTARVAVNRVWQKIFGKGLVESSYDFGNQGALPSHPELLDFLAVKFRTEGWDIKELIKFMVLSTTYQQSSGITEEMQEKDPENTYLARASRIRLSAEMIRDQALKISGLLNTEVGGPSVKPYQPDGIWEETTGGGGGSTATYVQSTGNDLYRKSLYTFWKRTVPPPSMMTFDAASRDLCIVKRQETNTPLQALVLLNDPQLIEAARALAVNAHTVSTTPKDQIRHIFQTATSRIPNEDELTILHELYLNTLEKTKTGEVIPEEYLSIGEFSTTSEAPTDTLAALALTAHTILNLDETISRG